MKYSLKHNLYHEILGESTKSLIVKTEYTNFIAIKQNIHRTSNDPFLTVTSPIID